MSTIVENSEYDLMGFKIPESGKFWLDHFSQIESDNLYPIIIKQEELMLSMANNIQNQGKSEEDARGISANIMMASTLGLQYKYAPGSQEEMTAMMALFGPWNAFRKMFLNNIKKSHEIIIWKIRFFALLGIGIIHLVVSQFEIP